MKKTTLIIAVLGLIILNIASYYTKLSNTLSVQLDKKINNNLKRANKISRLEKRIESIRELSRSQSHYEYLDLNIVDYYRVNTCLKDHIEDVNLPSDCMDYIVDLLIDYKGKVDFIESIIGYSIYYNDFSVGYWFPRDLFEYNASFDAKVVRHFLNRYRNPQKLEEEFNTYKSYFYNRIPKSIYDKVFNKIVTDLLNSFNDIEQQEDKESYFKEIYAKAEIDYSHSDYWTITFWKRRAEEKNDTVVFNILTEIKKHYE
ncbi:MAG: hypothetical protein N4A45_06920 [Flavobacteriales bacterium]|jgi:hypothetical protein|nr:hypothetical protein [Flavobacteriales bacterium]